MREPTYDVQLVRPDDGEAARRLGREAFGWAPPAGGPPTAEEPAPVPQARAGSTDWGAYLGDELAAKLTAHDVTSWFGGVELATMAVSGVTVGVEHRGVGLLSGLVRAALADHEGRGTAVSTLFPTAAGIYRRFGYELITSSDAVELPVAALASLDPGTGIRLRRATESDLDSIAGVYTRWARGQNGPLARRGPALTSTVTETMAQHSGITLAEDGEGAVVGYAAWSRGEGYGPQATLAVRDLYADTAAAYRALWASLGHHGAAVGTVRLRTSGADVARTFVPTSIWKVVTADPYMLRVVDVAHALSGRAALVELDTSFSVAGDSHGSLDGTYRLRSESGLTTCERVGSDLRGGDLATYSPRGLALMVAGAQSSASVRAAGQLTGPDDDDLAVDVLLGGRQQHVRDYF